MSYEKAGFVPVDMSGDVFPMYHTEVSSVPVHVVDPEAFFSRSTQETVRLLDVSFGAGSFASRLTAEVGPTKNLDGEQARLYDGKIGLKPGVTTDNFQYGMDVGPFFGLDASVGEHLRGLPKLRTIRSFFHSYEAAVEFTGDSITVSNQHDSRLRSTRVVLVPPTIEEVKNPREQLESYLAALLPVARVAHRVGTFSKDFPRLLLDDLIITPLGPMVRNPDTGEYVHTLERDSVTVAAVKPPESKPDSAKDSRVPESATFDQLHGIDDIKRELRMLIASFSNPDTADKWGISRPNGLLLHGPPGTGKSSIVYALANAIGAEVRKVKGSDIHEMWLGASERNITEIFEQAAAAEGPYILFFDELEGIVSTTTSKTGASSAINGVAAIFKTASVDLAANPHVILAAATNYPERIDQSLIRAGRFDLKLEVGHPDSASRYSILENLLRERQAARDNFDPFLPEVFEAEALSSLADITAGMVGADIVNILNLAAARKAVAELDGQTVTPISVQDIRAEILQQTTATSSGQTGQYL